MTRKDWMNAIGRPRLAIGFALLLATLASSSRAHAQIELAMFLAANGTTYELLRPQAPLTAGADRIRVTAVSGAASGLASSLNPCFITSATSGQPVASIVGTLPPDILRPLGSVVRTGAFFPGDDTFTFHPSGGGRLTLGSGGSAHNVCRRPIDCTGQPNIQPLAPADTSALGLPAACVALDASAGAMCDGTTPPTPRDTYGFGILASDCACDTSVTANTTVCAPEPVDGFTLDPKQAVVFIYDSSCATGFSVGAAGFLIDADGVNSPGCAANEVVAPTFSVAFDPNPPPPPCVPSALC